MESSIESTIFKHFYAKSDFLTNGKWKAIPEETFDFFVIQHLDVYDMKYTDNGNTQIFENKSAGLKFKRTLV